MQFPRTINKQRLPNLELNVRSLSGEVNIKEFTTCCSAALGDLFVFDYNAIGKNTRKLIGLSIILILKKYNVSVYAFNL